MNRTPDLRHEAFLCLGSNLGNKELNLKLALRALEQAGIKPDLISAVYKTEPVDFKDQDWFLNQVTKVRTSLDPSSLLNCCLKIERGVGRVRQIPKGPRNIDLDILLYDHLVLKSQRLVIPHPRMHLRRFVLEPLATIAAEFMHPVLEQPISILRDQCKDNSKVYRTSCLDV